MSRRASLKPTLDENRQAKGFAAYRVNVPPSLSPTGKLQQLYFRTKAEAMTACEQIKTRRENFGNSLTTISSDRIIEASKAFQLLEGTNVTLLSAVQQFLEIHKARSKSVTYAALVEEYLKTLAGCSHEHVKSVRNSLNRYPELLERMVCDITNKDLEDLMANDPRGAVTNGARKNLVNAWKAFFNHGIYREYLTVNPISKLQKVRNGKKTEVEIVSVEHVQAMLNDALVNDLDLLPMLTIGFFCGVRADGELLRLDWSDVHWTDQNPQVVLKPEITKKNKRRFVDLSLNAVAWIKAYVAHGGKTEGPVVSWSADRTVQDHRKANRDRAGVNHWPNSGMRHSYCSYWLNLHHDANKLVLVSGHDDADVMWTNYHKGTTEAEAKAFWSILPPKQSDNVIQLPKAV